MGTRQRIPDLCVPTQRQQVQALDQRQRIQMQGASGALVISWRGNRCLVSVSGRYHGVPPGHRHKPRSRSILPLPPQLRNALRLPVVRSRHVPTLVGSP
jgi:hypothetical protein